MDDAGQQQQSIIPFNVVSPDVLRMKGTSGGDLLAGGLKPYSTQNVHYNDKDEMNYHDNMPPTDGGDYN